MAQSPVQRRIVSRVSVRPPGASAPSCLVALYDNADVEIRTAEEDKPLMALLRSAIGTTVEGPERLGRCRKALEDAGYALLDIPLNDLELKVVFDPQTGRTVGASRGLHESAVVVGERRAASEERAERLDDLSGCHSFHGFSPSTFDYARSRDRQVLRRACEKANHGPAVLDSSRTPPEQQIDTMSHRRTRTGGWILRNVGGPWCPCS
jgi:hypothetical protein